LRHGRASIGRARRRACCAAALLAIALSAALVAGPPWGGATSRAAGGSAGEPSAYTDGSVPAREVTLIGSTPSEAGGGKFETWGLGNGAGGPVLVRYTAGEGNSNEGHWLLGPALQDQAGQPLKGFELDTPEAFSSTAGPSPIAGQMTADGAAVLAGSIESGKQQVLLVRNPNGPGNAFRETKPVPEGLLEHGERLFGLTRAPLIAPLDQGSSHTGALVVPVKERAPGVEEHVLHWDGESEEWSSEQIELPAGASSTEFRVLGIGSSSPTNSWLLAQLSEGHVALFRRHAGGGEPAVWRPVPPSAGAEAGAPLEVEGEPVTIPGADKQRVESQVLTVTSQGVWIDAERPEVKASTTIFYTPEHEGSGPSTASWCYLGHSPPGTKCQHALPKPLPSGAFRSFAWPSSAPYGERIITGFREGASLRLDGTSLDPLLALGGAVGSTYGAAFTSPSEGWLGDQLLPVHLTLETLSSRLTPWPVSFRHALVAVAPQPGATVGAVSSEAVAVGDLGEVTRYLPGKGWLPESLLGPGGRHETPRLRGVAWPTPKRIFAVGDLGQMWLWRGETGLWEPDPAAPYNFRGNLLGVAFDPNDPARGYAVGEGGVLLSYGKTWSQEPQSSLPPQVAHASFTSVAFAGSEAMVAYRVLPNPSIDRYLGGLLVNDGSGWRIDQGAAEVMGTGVPWAVAGLPDGGAAFAASGIVYERESSSAPWHAAATPFPGAGEPGSLSLFRENGAVRVVAASAPPDTYTVESAPSAPPGFPPTLIAPYPLTTDTERGVLRQTATGWSDELHEVNNAREPEGHWKNYDQTYQPDPVSAVLVDPGGSQGWAVGGFVEPEDHEGVLDTADVARYRGEGAPVGASQSPISAGAGTATFAIGGNASCSAPCAERAKAKIGPDVWLSSALSLAQRVSGARAFLYTGPRVVSPTSINGPKTEAATINYASEEGRYAQLLRESPLPAFAAGSPTDLDEAGGLASFKQAFSTFPAPFGEGSPGVGLPAGEPAPACGAGCAYYAFNSTGASGTVRVIMLDDSREPAAEQIAWVTAQLRSAAAEAHPAIVVGNADLGAELLSPGSHPFAQQLAEALVTAKAEASAYFFDSPEVNIKGRISASGRSVPTFGSGTLGYVNFTAEASGAFLGASGFLLGEVLTAKREAATNQAPVTARLIPNIGELAMEAQDGTLLRRSQAALFAALARRPRAGNQSEGGGTPRPSTDLYVPIPSYCNGNGCASAILPEYSFSSSREDIGAFVAKNEQSADPRAVLLNSSEKPIVESKSGLFCAFNAGTTTVTISAGGLSASLPVTVQAGSVRRPCGTVKLKELPVKQQVTPPAPAPAPGSTPAGVAPTPLPLPAPPLPAATPALVAAKIIPPAPFVPLAAASSPLLAIVPPPIPTPARPTPPSGTSPVSQPVEAPEKEEETEEATESVGNNAVAYRSTEHEPSSAYLIGIIVIAAFAGAGVRARPRRGRRGARVAPATISAMRSQRRVSERDPRRPW